MPFLVNAIHNRSRPPRSYLASADADGSRRLPPIGATTAAALDRSASGARRRRSLAAWRAGLRAAPSLRASGRCAPGLRRGRASGPDCGTRGLRDRGPRPPAPAPRSRAPGPRPAAAARAAARRRGAGAIAAGGGAASAGGRGRRPPRAVGARRPGRARPRPAPRPAPPYVQADQRPARRSRSGPCPSSLACRCGPALRRHPRRRRQRRRSRWSRGRRASTPPTAPAATAPTAAAASGPRCRRRRARAPSPTPRPRRSGSSSARPGAEGGAYGRRQAVEGRHAGVRPPGPSRLAEIVAVVRYERETLSGETIDERRPSSGPTSAGWSTTDRARRASLTEAEVEADPRRDVRADRRPMAIEPPSDPVTAAPSGSATGRADAVAPTLTSWSSAAGRPVRRAPTGWPRPATTSWSSSARRSPARRPAATG